MVLFALTPNIRTWYFPTKFHTASCDNPNRTEGIMSSSKKFQSEKKPGSQNSVLKYIGVVIVGLALLGLIFSSVLYKSGGGGSKQMVFGKYGNREIVYRYDNAFGQAVETEMAKYRNSVDKDNQFFSFVRFMAWQQAFNSIVVNTAISYQLDKSGYDVSSRAVDRRIIDSGPFRTNGQFDENIYRNASATQKASVRKQFEEQLTLETWSQDVLDSQYRSSQQVAFLESMRSKTRTYDYVSVPFTDYPDEKVIAYARENTKLFTRLPVSRISVSDKETADEVRQKIDDRKQEIDSFAELARQFSEDAYKDDGGNMGPTDFYQLSEILGSENTNEIFSLEAGDVAGPYETDYGWLIVKVDGPPEESDPAERLDIVKSYMLQNEVGIIEDATIAKVERVRVEALAADSFREAAQNVGYEVATTPAFPINFGGDTLLGSTPETSGDPELSGTVSSDEFWSKIAPLTRIGAVSEPVVLGDSVAVFSLAAIEEVEPLNYWDSMVKYELARSRQEDFQVAILSADSELLENNFSETYDQIFPTQG